MKEAALLITHPENRLGQDKNHRWKKTGVVDTCSPSMEWHNCPRLGVLESVPSEPVDGILGVERL